MTDSCPDESAFVGIAKGTLPTDERLTLLDHVDGCASCHELLAGVLRERSQGDEETLVGDRPLRATRPKAGTRIDHYVVSDFLGAGAMGEVLRAADTVLGREAAIKLLGRMPGPKWGDRLVREAQAMARLSHPNVVTVYGVGEWDAGAGETIFYVAMELVEGTTLTEWSRQDHPWIEVLSMWVAAGEGLAAAHERGIVHRDFKPDNVLVGNDGRPRVGDFGLAAAMDEELEDVATDSDDALSLDLTRTGEVIGTPRFMAPEQLRGAPLDHRADQFAFAVSLYRALYGKYPYEGRSITEIVRAYKEPPSPPPSGHDVPSAVWTALRRALQVSRKERFPDMNALLSDLRNVLGRRRRTRAVAASLTVGVLGLGGGIVATELTQERPCDRVGEGINQVWNDQVRSDLGTALSDDVETFGLITRRLDRFAASWQQAAGELCRATHVQRIQSEEALQVRMGCLDRQRGRIAATLDVLLDRPQPMVVQRAIPTLEKLETPSVCRNLTSFVDPEPADSPFHKELNELFALEQLGLAADARPLGESLLERIEAPETRAVVFLTMGNVYEQLGEAKLSREALQEAARHGSTGENDSFVALAWIQRTWQSIEEQKYREAKVQLEAAVVAAQRGEANRGLDYQITRARAKLYLVDGETELALAEVEKSLAAADEERSSLARATSLALRAEILVAMTRYDEAVADAEEQLDLYVAELGTRHPSTLLARYNVASILLSTNQLDAAQEQLQTTLVGYESVVGKAHLNYVNALAGLVVIDGFRGAHESTIERGKEVLELLQVIDQPNAENGIYVRNAMAQAYGALGQHDAAEETISEAIAIQQRLLGTEHPALTVALIGRGETRRAGGAHERALEDFEHALKLSAENSMDAAYAKTGIGHCKLALGERAEGERILREALTLHRKVRSNPKDIEALEKVIADLDEG